MSKFLIVLAGLTVLAPMFTAGYRDDESGIGWFTVLFAAMLVNAWLSQFVERGAWGLLFVQIPLAVVVVVPALRVKRARRDEQLRAPEE